MAGPPKFVKMLQGDDATSSDLKKKKRKLHKIQDSSALEKQPLQTQSEPTSPRPEAGTATPPVVINLDAPGAELAPPKPGYGRAALWSLGVTPELRTPLRPADRWLEGQLLTKDEITELEGVESGCLKAASMLRGYIHFRNEYAILAREYLRLEAEKKQAVTDKDLAVAAKDEVVKEKATLETKNTGLIQDLAKSKSELDDAVKELGLQRDARADAEKKCAELDKYKAELKKIAYESHSHTIELVKFLNPDLPLNLTGLHPLAYVEDGQLVSPAEASETAVDGDGEDEGEEAGSGAPAVGGGVQLADVDAAV